MSKNLQVDLLCDAYSLCCEAQSYLSSGCKMIVKLGEEIIDYQLSVIWSLTQNSGK